METNAAFIRADGIVELHAIAEVVLNLALIVNPCHTESYDAVGFNHSFDNLVAFELGMLVVDLFNRHEDFVYCLKVFLLARMLGLQGGHDCVYVHNDFSFFGIVC